MRPQSPSQTVGPFFAFALVREGGNVLVNEETQGEHILLRGQVLDGDAQPVDDALVEIWQADAQGRFRHPADPNYALADPHFRGFGRSGTASGGFWFRTVKPGPVPPSPVPCIAVRVFARGMLIHAVSRLYFSDHDNTQDPLFASLDPERRETLVAERQLTPAGVVYRWDIRLQGPRETVFFDL
ncbi:protocatechuate 3,4-dioxygenase subunit alpha [Meiothermus sp.]|jgi:protocatechuate 3,4-dioxygenase alpha subunit|uniref:protocatechuate 3,4-dioxygenase subunit alpha n=1 Tax=Meiothermus sp. TaxID=1955249 RepID=UPI0021DDE967|nr:protocatechuate 3,4-dioxygenase subunit alpha [Meiothermus sp.]GIW25031.1 MAG: protocatechuate 3,4-dioxygenase subunit alpha [Meiothermus sp.]